MVLPLLVALGGIVAVPLLFSQRGIITSFGITKTRGMTAYLEALMVYTGNAPRRIFVEAKLVKNNDPGAVVDYSDMASRFINGGIVQPNSPMIVAGQKSLANLPVGSYNAILNIIDIDSIPNVVLASQEIRGAVELFAI